MKYLLLMLLAVGAVAATYNDEMDPRVPYPKEVPAPEVKPEKPDWVIRAEANMVAAMRQSATADSLILGNAVPRGLTKDEARQAQLAADAANWHRCVAIKMLAEKRVP
jgi:hypothetical protein